MSPMNYINSHWSSFDDLAPDLDSGHDVTENARTASTEALRHWLIHDHGYTEQQLSALAKDGVTIRDIARIQEDSGYSFSDSPYAYT